MKLLFIIYFIIYFSPTSLFAQATAGSLEVKNNSVSPLYIEDIGRILTASSTAFIDETNWGLWAQSEDIDPLIDNDTIDILLHGIVLGNDRAREVIHGKRTFSVTKVGGADFEDILEVQFDGPSIAVSQVSPGVAKVTIGDSVSTVVGKLFTQCWGEDKAGDKWIGAGTHQNKSNEVMLPLPWDSTLLAITFTNKERDADQLVNVWKVPFGGVTAKSLEFSWVLNTGVRAAVKNDLAIDFDAFDKVSVFIEKDGKEPKKVSVCLYFKIRTDNVIDTNESWNGNLNGGDAP